MNDKQLIKRIIALALKIKDTENLSEIAEELRTMEIEKMSKAARFFRTSKVAKKKDINYKFQEKEFGIRGYGSNQILPDDCWEQIREWAGDFARAKIKKTPEGKILATLEDNKRTSYKEIMEAGSPDSLKTKLHNNLQKDGLSWNREVKALPPTDQTIN